ncbi:MAG: DUF512 domain-containing protein [Oscillospiraceae bacterium]|nr:DUF512 domain-containing protein [Oscillospiraceae bacterium]
MSLTAVCAVAEHSPAHRAGVRVGEVLTHVNGQAIVDVLDYKFYTYDPELTLTLTDAQGGQRTLSLVKREGEDLGLTFETYLMDRARSCANRCIFCFVDQLPRGMRKSLYFKDDDARLSFLMGNYITLTNLSDREVQRIIDLRVSPINISVHTTDRALRAMMLGNKNAGRGIDIMERLAAANITMNCQIVACPGINDGPALARTLTDLAGMYPAVNSVSVVPVGVTCHRQGLYPLQPYTRQQAEAVLEQVEAFAAEHKARTGTSLVWCSDEFYLLAGRALPEEDYFEDFTQLDNGVGMLRLLMEEFRRALGMLDEADMGRVEPFSIATGVSAAPFLARLVERAKAVCPRIEGTVYPIQNDFFGRTIVVAGLVTGWDLMAQLEGKPLGRRLLIPESMLRAGERVFLDDVTVEDVEARLGVPIVTVGQDGWELCEAMFNIPREEMPQPEDVEETEYFRYR